MTLSKITTTANSEAFEQLLKNYEIAYNNRNKNNPKSEAEFANALTELATACTYSVLKKLCNAGGAVKEDSNKTTDSAKVPRQLRATLARDINALKQLKYCLNNGTAQLIDKNGNTVIKIINKDLYNGGNKLASQTLDDGLDLLHTAIIAILDETKKHNSDLTTEYIKHQLNKKVWIKLEDSKNGWTDTTTTSIQEVYKAIRREVSNNRSIQIASHKYAYIDDIVSDNNGNTEKIYRRLNRHAALDEVYNSNGAITSITADNKTVFDIDMIMNKLELSKRESQILQLRLAGYGYKAIGTYLGIRTENVKLTLRRVQAKAIKIGFKPPTIDENRK